MNSFDRHKSEANLIPLFMVIMFGVLVFSASTAMASGLPMATEWSWARDGGRIVNASILAAGIIWLMVKFGGPILRNRAELISERLDSIENSRAKAEKSLGEYEVKIKEMEAEAEKIRSEARAEGEMIKKKLIEQAEHSAKQIMQKASERISLEAAQARKKLQEETASSAINIAEEILRKNINAGDQKRLVKEYISKMENKN